MNNVNTKRREWGEVSLILGTSSNKCEYCENQDASVVVKTWNLDSTKGGDFRDRHLCKECIGFLIGKHFSPKG